MVVLYKKILERLCSLTMEITVNCKGQAEALCERSNTAKEMGSGSLLVYATPSMVALMEEAACSAIAEALPEEKTSVGISMDIQHVAATPVGLEVRAEATVTEVNGKIITFSVEAFDEKGQIGKGTHKRCIVDTQRFLDKAYEKI